MTLQAARSENRVARSMGLLACQSPSATDPDIGVLHYTRGKAGADSCRTASALLGAEPGRHRFGAAAEAVFAEQPVEVGAHGPVRKAQPRRHLLVRKPGGDK